MRNYIQNEVYSWLSSDTAEILLKLFYKKDIMLLVAWVDPLTEKYCVHRFVDDSCSSQIMKNMFSYLFKRISDMKFRAEDERLSDVVLKKGQKTLAQQYPLQAKAMGQFPLNVNLLSDTEIAHSFESKLVWRGAFIFCSHAASLIAFLFQKLCAQRGCRDRELLSGKRHIIYVCHGHADG